MTTLYKKNTKGKIYVWKIYSIDNFIVTENGCKDGKMVIHKKEVKKGKQKRNLEEQIEFEMESKIKSQMDKKGYVKNIDDIKKEFIKPMLAKTYVKKKEKSRAKGIEFPAYAQRKYDGIRCLAYLENGNVKLVTRNLKEFKNFNIIRKDCKKILKKNMYLDGELYTNKLKFENISRLTRKYEVEGQDEIDMNKIKYHIYDCIFTECKNLTNKNRILLLNKMNKKKFNNIKFVKTDIVNNHNEVLVKHNEYVLEGFEGIMLRNMNGIYGINKRSKDLQKYKEFKEDEYIICGYHQEDGNNKGCVVWECKIGDNIFSAKPKGTIEFRQNLYNNGDKYIGKKLTVIYQELTKDGIPRFPVGKSIREDI